MAVIRIHKTKDFTIMSNYHLRDENISLKAKGLLSVMLSLSENWVYSIQGLVSICKEQETAIASAINELKAHGYVEVEKNYPTKENGGRIEYVYNIYEKPIQEHRKQGIENLWVEHQGIENSTQLNTNIPNTKKQSTKKLSTEELKEKCKKENPEVFDVIAFWNERSVDDKCEGGKGSVNAIKKALTKYTVDEIKTAIDHYKQVINDDSYYYSYSWKIELFLVRQGGITEFFDDGSKWKNYLADKNKKKTATRPTASPDSDEAQREFHEDLKRYGLI